MSNAEVPSTEIVTPAAISHGPSGSATSETFARDFSTFSASLVIFAMSGCTPFHAFVTQPMRSARGAFVYLNDDSAASTSPQSSAVRAIGPILSIEYASAIAPSRLTRSNVGRSPEIPQYADGQMMDPHVSVPMANGASIAETIAPEPLDEPHVQHVSFHGFFAPPCSDAVP